MFIQESPVKYWRIASAAGAPDAGRVSSGARRESSHAERRRAGRDWQPFCDRGPVQLVVEGRPESIKETP
jgi:hypothetical protein